MDPHNPVVKLCIEGTQAEFAGQPEAAHRLYQKAWTAARDDFEACIAAHYVARHQESLPDKLSCAGTRRRWLEPRRSAMSGWIVSILPSI